MTDIVEQLRTWASGNERAKAGISIRKLLADAADETERLRAVLRKIATAKARSSTLSDAELIYLMARTAEDALEPVNADCE